MDHFQYQNDQLFAESVSAAQIAQIYGTPTYVYSRATIERHYRAYTDALGQHPHLICYAVKANSNLAVLNVLARLGAGFDIVSGGELARVLKAGGDPKKVVFSGVGKTEPEIHAALDAGIKCFNVESEPELYRIEKVCKDRNQHAPISIRVNPDINPKTHPYISTGMKDNKFGVSIPLAKQMYQYAQQSELLDIHGIDCHIGSQLTEIQPFLDALERVMALVSELMATGITFQHVDVGGGLGVTYQDETPPHPREYSAAIVQKMQNYPEMELIFEPGRAIMANAGILLTQVEFIKPHEGKNFAIVDAAMNDLLRPSLYQAWQNIVEVKKTDQPKALFDIVGPVCETGDFLGKERELSICEGDLLAVRTAGAYGFTMSSNYNSRGRAAEVMVDDAQIHLIRERETHEQLWQGESVLPE
ncbi:diaminopimelate decarboxylase [Algicola sagamiensis]|uniref:diaminopimelate decarboxylase n=1 Tax=Algicola sagamiensis TaxID=163869 RepID=UPI00037611FB|nr:diaminopimelate decarboxylase [Algicola sagamiensis]